MNVSTAIRQAGGRKFILSVLTLTSATYLVAAGHIADGVYSAVVIANIGAYAAANVLHKKGATDAQTASNP